MRYHTLFLVILMTSTFFYPHTSHAQEADPAIVEAFPIGFYIIVGVFLLVSLISSVYFLSKILGGDYALEPSDKLKIATALIVLPPLVLMALFVKDFNGGLVFGIFGMIAGFLTGQAFDLSRIFKSADKD